LFDVSEVSKTKLTEFYSFVEKIKKLKNSTDFRASFVISKVDLLQDKKVRESIELSKFHFVSAEKNDNVQAPFVDLVKKIRKNGK
jgi:hypothetical protein